MIIGFIKGQQLNISTPLIVADTIDYLTADFHFQISDWQGATKWAHFSQGDTVYDIKLADDKIDRSAHLNLASGEWSVYLHGNTSDGMRITTEPQTIMVKNTGALNGEPFPELPLNVAEQLSANIGDLGKLETEAKDSLVDAINEIFKNGGTGGEQGADGVGVENIEQTTTSTEDNGVNVITVTLTNGEQYRFEVRNGSKGSKGEQGVQGIKGDKGDKGETGEPGYSPVRGTDYWTEADKAEIKSYVDDAILGGAW